jgi:hypothetical protein
VNKTIYKNAKNTLKLIRDMN